MYNAIEIFHKISTLRRGFWSGSSENARLSTIKLGQVGCGAVPLELKGRYQQGQFAAQACRRIASTADMSFIRRQTQPVFTRIPLTL